VIHTPTSPEPPLCFSIFAAVSPVHDEVVMRDLVERHVAPMRALGGVTSKACGEPTAGPLVVFVATGGTESLVLQAVATRPREPALLVAHPGHNSLPASLEALARLQQQGVRGRILYLCSPSDREALDQLRLAVHDSSVRRTLCESRIGLVGAPSDWLVASSPAPDTVRSVWGPTVVSLPVGLILAEPDHDVTASGERIAKDVRVGATELVGLSESELPAAGRVHALLRRVVDQQRLDAVAVRCFDLVLQRKTSGCLALAQLNDEGVTAGCEGDLVATVAMLWARRMFGTMPWMANPSRIDPARGTLSLAHCTVPRSMCSTYRLRSHFESGLGVSVQGTLRTGPVTLVRIGGKRMERLRAIEGELTRNTDHEDLCRTQVEVEIGGNALRDLLGDPLGNHIVMIPGRRADRLMQWHAAMVAEP
jgi:L-fucose isomerase-like protein